ncbi:hypothetical protein [Streptomyces celluloflavus]|uniref:Uncharacterized protein n=1 Tax=Streptomyces celluloflavus TaxID=58344 RepID=A0ABW7R5J7_9ACTN
MDGEPFEGADLAPRSPVTYPPCGCPGCPERAEAHGQDGPGRAPDGASGRHRTSGAGTGNYLRSMTPAVHLGDPTEAPPDPVPVAGCAVCEALSRQRDAARARRDRTRAVDCNIGIRRHPHTASG